MPTRKYSSSGQPARGAVRKPTLSPTRIGTYLECAVKYRYVYIDKIGRFYLRARAGYSFGSTLHHVLQQFHEKGSTHTPEEMAAQLEQSWIGAGYETSEQEQAHLESGRQIVEAYHAAHQERTIVAVETIATEKTITFDMGRFRLSGRVDRIDRHADSRMEIIDYKSGRLDVSPDEVRDSLAMSCYQLILRKLNPGVPVFATIYCLRSGRSASAMLEGEELERFERDVVLLADEILDRDYMDLEPTPVPACADCDFYSRCARFWRTQEQREIWDDPDISQSEHGL